jgi:E3 ubiquitin-protein ligase HECTD2
MLMGVKPTFDDLRTLHPALARGLDQLLEYDGDVESDFCRSFVVEREHFGSMQIVELKPRGAHIPVSAHNRQGAHGDFA